MYTVRDGVYKRICRFTLLEKLVYTCIIVLRVMYLYYTGGLLENGKLSYL